VQKFTGKMPEASDTTSIEHRALTVTVRTPQCGHTVWGCLWNKWKRLRETIGRKMVKGNDMAKHLAALIRQIRYSQAVPCSLLPAGAWYQRAFAIAPEAIYKPGSRKLFSHD